MSEQIETTLPTHHDHHEVPGLEPWLRVMLLSIVPLGAAFVVPEELYLLPLGAAALPLAAGLGMLARQQAVAARRGARR